MDKKTFKLNSENHDRDIFDSKYVYPVLSRRAGGLSLGINLNTNNACNWQCIYCEIPNLTRGNPEPIDLNLLEDELRQWLFKINHTSFIEENSPPNTSFADIAFSGNGEPTAAKEFGDAVNRSIKLLDEFNLINKIPIRLITNGSFIYKNLDAMKTISEYNGEVWFKVDAANTLAMKQIHNNLNLCIRHVSTVVQSCFLKIEGSIPSNKFLDDYINFINPFSNRLKGIHIYSLARPSYQKSEVDIQRLDLEELSNIRQYINNQIDCLIDIFP
jgi:pyruvate-formate lyase-activating enzyme